MSDGCEASGELLGARMPAHLYVHVPFCASKCGYCDFGSVAGAREDVVQNVFAGIRTQLARWSETGLLGVLDTIYVGGGTPSLYPNDVAYLLAFIAEKFVVHGDAEITVEANPDSLSPAAASAFARAGATRVSVGVQSFDDHVLRVLGRRHDVLAARAACATVVDAGLDLSIDLICGVPGQSMTSWSDTLESAWESGARHVSVYPLSIEDGTDLQVAISAGLLGTPDPDEAASMMLLAESTFGYHGLARYEVASYATDSRHESRHNTAYWSGRPYIGVGPGSHGMLDAATARAAGFAEAEDAAPARIRYANSVNIEQWLHGAGGTVEPLTAEEVVREDVMLGMRLVRGVSSRQVAEAGLTGVLESLAADGLVELASDVTSKPGPNWRTTQRGWLLGNQVFSRVWTGE